MKNRLISGFIIFLSVGLLMAGCTEKVARADRDKISEETSSEVQEESSEPIEYPLGYGPSHYYAVYKLNGFTTSDTEGNVIDDSIFEKTDFTMINIWGTYCGPCINELADLQALSESLPDNIQIIGLVCDVYDGEDCKSAVDILDAKGVTYTNILCNENIIESLTGVSAVPTTIFVNSDGYVICNPIVGADISSYKKVIKDLGK